MVQYFNHEGVQKTAYRISKDTGVPFRLLRSRLIVLGWDLDRAVSTPARKTSRVNYQTMTKICSSCDQEKPLEKFRADKRKNGEARWTICKSCSALNTRDSGRQAKDEAIRHYSDGTMACQMCGYDTLGALTIDHINGGGGRDRRSGIHPKGGGAWYKFLIKLGFPEGFRVLCRNCNWLEHLRLHEMTETWGKK